MFQGTIGEENDQFFVEAWTQTEPLVLDIDFSGFFLFFSFLCFVIGFTIASRMFNKN